MNIAVLISGGVDSAVVVDKLFREGHKLTLFYIRIGMDNEDGDCSAEEDIEMCSLIASRYDLPFKIVPLHQEYWDYVMGYALESVKNGFTPNPDMMCNKFIKFGFFEQRYGKDFDKTATGHYARIETVNDIQYLATACDPIKDQTDFLSAISYKQLCHSMFPIGDLPKEEVRKLAETAHLPNAGRKDSQGICFLGKIDYREFIKRKLGVWKGEVIDIESEKVIGTHDGHWLYTIGQRKGLGLGGGPWFIIKKDSEKNRIFVSRGYETPLQYKKDISIGKIHWISGDPFSQSLLRNGKVDIAKTHESAEICFKIRHTPDFANGRLIMENGNNCILSDSEIQGVAPGQFATIYTPDHKLCLGNAMII